MLPDRPFEFTAQTAAGASPQIGGNAFQGVSTALGQRYIARPKGLANFPGRVHQAGNKPLQQGLIELSAAATLQQTLVDVDATDAQIGPGHCGCAPVADRAVQGSGFNRFGQVGVHAFAQATRTFVGRSVCRQRDDGQAGKACLLAQQQGSLMPVHHRHLQVHQHHGPGQGVGRVEQQVQRLLAVICQRDRDAHRFHQLTRNLLVDVVVFDQQHPHTGERRMALALVWQQTRLCQLRRNDANQGVPQTRLADRLVQKSTGASAAARLARLIGAIGRYHHHCWLMLQPQIVADVPGCLDAVHVGHLPIHQHHLVGVAGIGLLQCIEPPLAINGLVSPQAQRGQLLGQNLARRRVVVHHQNPDALNQTLAL